MTLAVLRALHAIIGDALDDIDAVYSTASLSSPCPSPSPSSVPSSTDSSSSSSSYSTHESSHPQRRPGTPPLLSNNRNPRTPAASPRKRSIDFPALDVPADSSDDRDTEAERLRAHPTVANAISRIVAACGQLSVTVRSPFLVLCDAGMGYHLPSALRFLEAAHIPELLSPAGPDGLHVSIITARLAPYLSNPAHPRTSGTEEGTEGKVAHILRLLATHHLLLERSPDVFALNRVSALLDTGKDFSEVVGCPEKKYENTDGIAAFFALNTDELFKASAYLTDSILPHVAPLEEDINRTLLPLSPPLGQSPSKSIPSQTTTPELRSNGERERERIFAHRRGQLDGHSPGTSVSAGSTAGLLSSCTPPPPPVQEKGKGRTPVPTLKRLLSRPRLVVPSPSQALSMPPLSPVSLRSPVSTTSLRSHAPSLSPVESRHGRADSLSPVDGSRARLQSNSSLSVTPRAASRSMANLLSSAEHEPNVHATPKASPLTFLKPRTPRVSLRTGGAVGLRSPGAFFGLGAPRGKSELLDRGELEISSPLECNPQMGNGVGLGSGLLEPAFTLAPAPIMKEKRRRGAAASYDDLGGTLPSTPRQEKQLETPAASRGPSVSDPQSPKSPQRRIRSGSAATPPPLSAFNLSQRTASHFWAWLEAPGNEARLARFGKAMGGSRGWEEDGIEAFPFASLPAGALVVDVGGGIGSTSMLLAERFPELRFLIQDREPVCNLGVEAWRARCPELLDSGRAKFQVHDFFTPQPAHTSQPGAFLLRVICHDWPDAFARRILLQLRRAAREDDTPTYLVIGDHVLPYACACPEREEPVVDKKGRRKSAWGRVGGEMDAIEGAEALRTLRGAKWPLLANLGKASANAYWMDLTMQATFNGQERTLPELVALTASAGWRILRVARTEGSLFGHIVAVPAPVPASPTLGSHPGLATLVVGDGADEDLPPMMVTRPSTPALDMFGFGWELPPRGVGVADREAEDARGQRRRGGAGMWVRWMKGRAGKRSKGDLREGAVGEKREGVVTMPSPPPLPPVPPPTPQGRGLLKKVSQYFGES